MLILSTPPSPFPSSLFLFPQQNYLYVQCSEFKFSLFLNAVVTSQPVQCSSAHDHVIGGCFISVSPPLLFLSSLPLPPPPLFFPLLSSSSSPSPFSLLLLPPPLFLFLSLSLFSSSPPSSSLPSSSLPLPLSSLPLSPSSLPLLP